MHPMVLLLGALLAGGPRAPAAAGDTSPATRRLVFDRQGEQRLVGELSAPPETTPPLDGYALFEEGPAGRKAFPEKVGAAVFVPTGVLLIHHGELVAIEKDQRRTLARGLFPELAVDSAGQVAALVRERQDGSSIELFDLNAGRTIRILTSSPGRNGAPLFGPDGRLYFVSTRTGLASIFRAGLDGRGPVTQLTNVGARKVGPGFVPPFDRTWDRRFEGKTLRWTAGGEQWSLDLGSGAAQRIGGAR